MLGLPRIALVVVASLLYVAWHPHVAFAKGDDQDDDEEEDGGDKGDKGDTEEEPEEEDKDQPLVTAGGNFTIDNYPANELGRPLTMTQKVLQARISAGTDLSAKGAFGTGGLSVEGVYGARDNVTVIGGIVDAYNFKQFSFYAGVETALKYDLVDFRAAANLHRFAIPQFCATNMVGTCDASSLALPNGQYDAGGVQFSIDLGVPIRYAFTPQIAIVAFQTLMSIDFVGVQRGDPKNRMSMDQPIYCSGVNTAKTDANGNPLTADPNNCLENGAKPDFDPSIGVATNPIPQLSLVIYGQLRIPDFDTSAGNFQVPVTGRVQFSATQKLDIGAEFTFLNVAPPAPQAPTDNRFLSLFMQARI